MTSSHMYLSEENRIPYILEYQPRIFHQILIVNVWRLAYMQVRIKDALHMHTVNKATT